MKVIPTPLVNACLIEMECKRDARGFFARAFCEREFEQAGLATRFYQINNSFSTRKGTLRGLHYQIGPASEVKVMRCVSGALYDIIADLRPDSASFGRWFGAILSAANRTMMYVSRGFAHGFLTLTDDAEALYLNSAFYAPEAERGLRWDDPWLAIEWPADPVDISPKDRAWRSFDPAFHGIESLRGLRGRAEPVEATP